MLHTENLNRIHKEQHSSVDKPQSRWNIHFVFYDTLLSRLKSSSNGHLSFFAWTFGIFDYSHWYKTKNSVGWPIAMDAKIGFNLQLTVTPEFHSRHDW
jgi:hypothetical protein